MEAESPEHDEQPVNEVNPGADFRFAIRPGRPSDHHFIGESWRRHYSSSAWARCPGGLDEYIATQKAVIAQCLATSQVLVAYPDMDEHREPDQVLGWICYRAPATVHYLFVKPYYRRKGIGRNLLLAALAVERWPDRLYATHGWRFPPGKGAGITGLLSRVKPTLIEYNPALIFGGPTP